MPEEKEDEYFIYNGIDMSVYQNGFQRFIPITIENTIELCKVAIIKILYSRYKIISEGG